MYSLSNFQKLIKDDALSQTLSALYGNSQQAIAAQKDRYSLALQKFEQLYGDDSVFLFSAPGRTELGGNHTDHNGGRVLAASVDLDTLAVVSKTDNMTIRIKSEGYDEITVDLSDLSIVDQERFSTMALVRGVCAGIVNQGFKIGGFNAYVTSNVLKGSGLSSSAAFEVLIATIVNRLYNDSKFSPILAAQIAQFAENKYFGKPCGLMDQTASSVGGLITIDFKDFSNPVVEKVDYDFAASGYTFIVVDTGGNHAVLNDEYASIENEMKAVARELGKNILRECSKEDLLKNASHLRTAINDRAILRAVHFFEDDERVVKEVDALKQDNFSLFLSLLTESGNSSWMLNQNCYLPSAPLEQSITLALTMTEQIINKRGGWRVQGGGFAGTIQAFVPNNLCETYVTEMEKIFGKGTCHQMQIRPLGAVCIEP